jgi:hypothetical protein
VIRSNIGQPTLTSNFVNPGVNNSYIAPGTTTTVTEVQENAYGQPTTTTVTTSNVGGGGVVNNAAALAASGFNQYGAAGPIASVGGSGIMPGPTGLGVDVAGRLVDLGRIRLEKIEHYPSYNLFSLLDDHPPLATFRFLPHKLRNY